MDINEQRAIALGHAVATRNPHINESADQIVERAMLFYKWLARGDVPDTSEPKKEAA